MTSLSSLSKNIGPVILALFLSTGVSQARDTVQKEVIEVLEKSGKGKLIFSKASYPPLGIVEMCQRIEKQNDGNKAKILQKIFNNHCGKETSLSTLHVKLTDQLYNEILSLNQEANKKIGAQEDIDTYNKKDVWTYPFAINGKVQGDCEDYVLYKFLKPHEISIPLQSLKIIMVEDPQYPNEQAHVVLGFFTDRGILILDNQKDEIYSVKDFKEFKKITGYTPLKIGRNQNNWKQIGE